MRLRKIILTMLASATILGIGANIQPTMASARHVRTYHYHKTRFTRHAKKYFHKRPRISKKNRKRLARKTKRNRKHVIHKRKYNHRRNKATRKNKRALRHKSHKNFNRRGYHTRYSHKRTNHITQPKSNYDIGVNKLTKLFIGWGYDPDDAKSDAKMYMNGGYNTSTGSPEIDAILDQYQNPSLRGDTSSSNAPDPNLPTAPQTPYAKAVENRTLYDMNQDRASIGKGPLQVTSGLTHLAEERAVQLTSDFDDYDQNGNDYDDEDDPDAIYGEESENICESFPGQSAKQAADMMNNSLFYREHPTQDQPYGGDHYNAIASSSEVGVGFYNGALAEDFHD